MKKFRFKILDNNFDIKIEKGESSKYLVMVNGKKYEAKVEDEFGKKLLLAVDGGLFNIEMENEPAGGKMDVKVNDRERVIESRDFFIAKEIAAPHKPIPTAEPQEEIELRPTPTASITKGIPAPMPGKVVYIKKNVGDEVKVGDVVLILEAMKMENEITSNGDGKVTEIRVKEGDSVDADDILIVIG